jgi:hypothetical protein
MAAGDFDIAGWTEPRVFDLQVRWLGWGPVAFVALLVLSGVDRPTGDDPIGLLYFLLAVLALLAVGLAIMLMRGGRVTIDPERREITWRRVTDRDARQTWAFADIQSAKVPCRGMSFNVSIDVGNRKLRLVVPTGAAEPLADSLQVWATSQRN